MHKTGKKPTANTETRCTYYHSKAARKSPKGCRLRGGRRTQKGEDLHEVGLLMDLRLAIGCLTGSARHLLMLDALDIGSVRHHVVIGEG